ncbi:hypothetical protein OOT33_00880 [Sphingobium sp. DEHP117]|uniref:hypothetical protein n=1 Tax=Sphingobium sp. DEHP117 TaxID=2993436 RepID=UPI0027D6A865|nr:hypothetical protein [Sphingobium sp. DEHP117]MDQ4419002.1 hypothetical protein [Sphingobium sp. DEHP117]
MPGIPGDDTGGVCGQRSSGRGTFRLPDRSVIKAAQTSAINSQHVLSGVEHDVSKLGV